MRNRTNRILRLACATSLAGLLLALVACRRAEPGTFATPEEAAAALASLVGSGDEKRAEEIFGPGSMDLFRTGDPEADREETQRVKSMITAKVGFQELDADTRVVLLGNEEWPFAIPLVRRDGRWRFDTATGRDELLSRRIGFFELSTLESLRAYVDAQREYAAEGRDGNPPAFAQRFFSTAGKHDGLYWETSEEEPESPLGNLLANAADNPAVTPEPFHGYFYRILKSQGKNAPGGEQNYLDPHGLMTRGFAAVAWPAKYGNSGVMTFLVNQRGVVYQKDLGAETATAAAAMQSYEPDGNWEPTGDSLSEYEDDDDGSGVAAEDEPGK